MTSKRTKIFAISLALLPVAGFAQEHGHKSNTAPYAGYQTREVKSLSDEDLEEIRRGGGWGLALPAELSNRPGPAHVLALKDELALSGEQVAKFETLRDEMLVAATATGEQFINAEATLSAAFEQKDLSAETLHALLTDAANARAELRFVHLSRHLSTPDLLSPEQIKKYNLLRGYMNAAAEQATKGE